MAATQLRALLSIISTGIDEVEATYAAENKTFPTADEPWTPASMPIEEKLAQTQTLVAAAAYQLSQLMRPPPQVVMEASAGMYLTAALGVADRTHVAEILREAGPKGMHVTDIASKSNINPRKLAPFLRLLAVRGIFKEVAPDVFANNRFSLFLDTGKTIEEIQRSPLEKYTGTMGVGALIGHVTDEVFRGSALLPEYVTNEKTSFSEEPADTSFGLAFGTNEHIFKWTQEPGNELRQKRFGVAMTGIGAINPPNAILTGFEWSSLKKGDVVVDVGGGIGSVTLVLAKNFPELKYVVQDMPAVTPEGIEYFNKELPGAIESGLVTHKPHDFFSPQPIQDAAVFLLRFITHDWPNAYAQKILRQLRDAAQPNTKLVLVDFVIPYAVRETDAFSDIPGAKHISLPEPLIPNAVMGWIGTIATLQMMNLLNATERTLGEFVHLGKSSGWNLERVHLGPGGTMSQIIFSPA